MNDDKKENYLVSNPNYHELKWFSEDLFATEIKKTKVAMNKTVLLGFITPHLSKIKMNNFFMTI